MISCGSRLAPFDIPQLREIMSYDELALDRIGDRKTAVFFTISDTTPTYNFLVALAFSQMFNLLCERADNVHGGRLPHHVRVLWDEAANTGQVPNLEKLVAVIRSREISLTLFYQQMAQCKAIYDKHAETIMGNMDSVVFLGGRESSTIKEISENWLGKSTIYMQTDGRSKGQSESYNLNTQRLGRELMTPAELATMPGDRCILQLRGLPPFYSPKYDLKQHPNYKYTAEADQVKNAFSLDKLINRRRRPGLNEACEVYEADGTDTGPIIRSVVDLKFRAAAFTAEQNPSGFLTAALRFGKFHRQLTGKVGTGAQDVLGFSESKEHIIARSRELCRKPCFEICCRQCAAPILNLETDLLQNGYCALFKDLTDFAHCMGKLFCVNYCTTHAARLLVFFSSTVCIRIVWVEKSVCKALFSPWVRML